jgi:hypothetical protein
MQDLITKIPTILGSDVSFIRPVSLPGFALKFEELKQSQFSFLYTLKDYMQYYLDLESKSISKPKKFQAPFSISDLGNLRPLDKRHALNSYWKWIRFSLKNEPSPSNPSEKLLLLPLKIDINIGSIKANGKDFPAKIFVYFFPFGSCCVNMNVKIQNINVSFDEFVDLSQKFLKYNITENKTFKLYSAEIIRKINSALFGESIEINDPIHTLYFINSTSNQLKFDKLENQEHINAILALLKGKKVSDISSVKVDSVNEELGGTRWPVRRKRELLFFTPRASLLYPSTEWIEGLSSSREKKHKLSCMRDNYQSFLNLTFAVNKFLHDIVIPNKDRVPTERLKQLKECFLKQFPEKYKETSTPVYFGHALDHLAYTIKLYDGLQKLALL